MAVKLAPVVKMQFFDANGDPLSGGFVYFYVAGSTTPQNTYTDSTGNTANANPITLNSRGETPSGVWLTEGLSYKYVLKDSAGVTIWTEDNIDGVNDATVAIDQWVASGLTPTYVSATQFTVPGDQTSVLTVGRRVKCTVTAGTVYGRITVSAFAALTTVTVVNDSGVLDSGLSAVSYGLLTSNNSSVPGAKLASGAWTFTNALGFPGASSTGDITMTGASIIESEGAAVASAASCNIWATDGNTVHITGTTGINDFATAPQAGAWMKVIFDGAVLLTQSANLNLNAGGANITTAADDLAFVYADTPTQMDVFVIRKSGQPVAQSSLSTASNSLGANVALNNTGTYFDGPSCAQGNSGTWLAIGTVTVTDSAGGANFEFRITDGTTAKASAKANTDAAGRITTNTLMGVFSSPAGNIRMQVRDITSTSGTIQYNGSTNGLDSTIFAVRIG